jgi:arylsulfatase A-like enzyme
LGKAPASYQGRDLLPLARGEKMTDWRTDFFCEHLMDNAKIPKYEGVRGSRYVYARYFENLPEGEFLHDLQADPKQLKNLISDPASAKALAMMRKRCDELRDTLGGEYSHENFPNVRRDRKKKPAKR